MAEFYHWQLARLHEALHVAVTAVRLGKPSYLGWGALGFCRAALISGF
ncbi:hypothetical protein [Acetobacter sp. DsW_063]|nr:hypothetical protein [Acetobacter sp. DsW_063]